MTHRRSRFLLLLMVSIALFVTGAAGQRPSARPPSAVDQAFSAFKAFYESGLKENGIVGSSAFFVRNGATLAQFCYGQADLERHHAVDEDTIYHWASITKTFTAVAIMQLRDRGRLRLDDPVVNYIPELRKVHDPYGDVSDITIRHLMTHSAGFREPTWPWGGDKPWHPFEPTEWSQLVAMLPYTEVEFKPGTRHSYSNPGIIFMGRIIQLLTDDDYEVYVDKNIFKPLEMYHSYFDTTPYHLLPHRSASYFVENGQLKPARFDFDTGITVSNGGLNAPLTDMVKYLNFLIGGGPRKDVYEGVLARRSLEEMFTPLLPVERDGEDTVQIGLNFFVEDRQGFHLVGHGGDQNGFIAHIYVCPSLGAGYAVAFNTQTPPATPDGKERTKEFDAQVRTWLLAHLFPALAATPPTPRLP